jgi:1A family penicillin-binding protein
MSKWKNGQFYKEQASSLKARFAKRGMVTTLIIIATFFVITPIITYADFAQDIKDKERLMNRRSTGVVLLDKNGEKFYSYGNVGSGNDATLGEISDYLEQALIASEDKDFYLHEGYSARSIAAAMLGNVINADPTKFGGSTITQQLVKNKLLSVDKNFFRKYQEVALAAAIERNYEKQEILEMYLNSVYFGEGAFGVEAASKAYFDKKPQDLTLSESSMLVGLLPAPSTFSPISGDKIKAKEQQKKVLTRMEELKLIDAKSKETALNEEITYKPQPKEQQKNAQHFAMMVLDELKNKYGEEAIIRGGFEVTTTLDLNWQRQAEQKISEKIAQLSKSGATNSSLVAIDPKNNEIRALVGSVNWHEPNFGKVNMANTPRQPGSSFKPIYYTEALDKKLITPATILKDAPIQFEDNYRPQNYDLRYRGDISARKALALSLNIPAIEVMQKVGVENASLTAQRMGITTVTEPQKYGLSLALGTAEAKLVEMTNAYAAFANNGNQAGTVKILSIVDKYNDKVYEHHATSQKKVTSPEASFLISSILSDNAARSATFGNSLNIDNRQVAVKTGTTDDSRDAWTIGYTPSLTVGVWVGDNQNRPMINLAGSSSAGQIWRETFKAFSNNTPNESFIQPSGITKLTVCANGLRAVNKGPGVYEEFFVKGSEPTGKCNELNPKVEEKKREEEKKPDNIIPQQQTNSGPGSDDGGRGGDNADPDNSDSEVPTNDEPNQPPVQNPATTATPPT